MTPLRRSCIAFGAGCSDGGIAVPGSSRCPAHSRGWRKTPQMLARSSLYDTPAWRKRRKLQLAGSPYCARCGAPANIADHIDNVGAGGSFDGPLQSLCVPCHNRKSSSEGGKAAKQKRNTAPMVAPQTGTRRFKR